MDELEPVLDELAMSAARKGLFSRWSRIEVRRFAGPMQHVGQLERVRVAHLTDMHFGLITPHWVQRQAVRLTNAARPDLVVITGDRHQNYAWDLKRDYADPTSPTVASEFVGTSITSNGDGADMNTDGVNFLAANPHMKFFNAQRGYVRVNVNRQRWRSDFRVLPYVQQPGAPVSTRASYVVEDRVPGVQEA